MSQIHSLENVSKCTFLNDTITFRNAEITVPLHLSKMLTVFFKKREGFLTRKTFETLQIIVQL